MRQAQSVSETFTPTIGATMRLIITAITLASIYSAFSLISPPAALPENAPAEEFSSGRAKKHVEAIARKPHPVGSVEHQRVRDYIYGELLRIGLDPQIQRGEATHDRNGEYYAASVENILARIRGTNNTKSVLLVAHYDSTPISYGASDNGSGVATLIETARALKAASSLKRDIALLFTDAEEVGLLGARVYAENKEVINDIGLVLNFEARGNSGASIMFETSDNNIQLVSEFAKSNPYPVTTSLSNQIYKQMPNDTDFSVFKTAGIDGLNFAYIKGITHYHTALDSTKNLDERSLQHHGSQALALTKHYGNLTTNEKMMGNRIYFSIGPTVIHYPESFGRVLALINVILFSMIAGYAVRRKLISLPRALLSCIIFLVSVAATVVCIFIIRRLIELMPGQYDLAPYGGPYNIDLYPLGMVLFAFSIFSTFYALCREKADPHSLNIGVLFSWMILTCLVTIFAPGGSYLFAWPLLFALGSTALLIGTGGNKHAPLINVATTSLFAIPGIILIVPIIYLIYISLGPDAMLIIIAIEALLLGLLTPLMNLLMNKRKWLIPSSTAVVALGLILSATIIPKFSHGRLKASHVFYAMNADSGKAVWGSFDERPDEWTSQFFPANAPRGDMDEYIPLNFKDILRHEARAIDLSPPAMTLLSDSTSNRIRSLRLQLTSRREAPLIVASVEPDDGIVSVRVNGKQIKANQDQRWRIRYFGAGIEGVELALELSSPKPVKIRAMDVVYELPDAASLKYSPRPENLIASPQSYSNSTLVSKTFSF